jgi:hypothetical protein
MSIQEANFKNPETHQRVKSRRDDMYTPRPCPPAMGQSPTHPPTGPRSRASANPTSGIAPNKPNHYSDQTRAEANQQPRLD